MMELEALHRRVRPSMTLSVYETHSGEFCETSTSFGLGAVFDHIGSESVHLTRSIAVSLRTVSVDSVASTDVFGVRRATSRLYEGRYTTNQSIDKTITHRLSCRLHECCLAGGNLHTRAHRHETPLNSK